MDEATGLAVNHRYSKQGSLHMCWTSSTSVMTLQLKSRLSKEYRRENPCRLSTLFCERSILTMLPIFACQLSQTAKLFIDRFSTLSSWRQEMSHSSFSLLDDKLRCWSLGTSRMAQSTFCMLLLAKFIRDSFFHFCWQKVSERWDGGGSLTSGYLRQNNFKIHTYNYNNNIGGTFGVVADRLNAALRVAGFVPAWAEQQWALVYCRDPHTVFCIVMSRSYH